MSERIYATYALESPYPLQRAAQALAGEQSTGTFVSVPGETDELKKRFGARIERLEHGEEGDQPSLPSRRALHGDQFHRGVLTVSIGLENVGLNLPTLISTLAGNIFELAELTGVKLLDVELPESFARAQPGPRIGVGGTRELCAVHGRPLIGTIIKPSVGLGPQETAGIVTELCRAGIDFIKDDELMGNPPHCPLEERVAAVMRVIEEEADRSGKKVMYAFNISDEYDQMLRNYELVRAAGGTCVMVSLNSVGIAALASLRRNCELAIHGHRNGWGVLGRNPMLGMTFQAYQKFWRLAGADHIHVNGLRNKFWEPDESVIASIAACLDPQPGGRPVMPVISSGQWGGQAPETYRRTKTVDVIYLSGGGIFGHPGGTTAGVRAIRQAWDAAVSGTPLQEQALSHAELRQSIEAFGEK